MSFVAVASLYFLKHICIFTLTVIFCYSVGALSGILVRFAFFIVHLTLCFSVVFCLDIYLIDFVYESLAFSVMFIASNNFDFFFRLSMLLF